MADMGYLAIGSTVVISFKADDHNGDTDLRAELHPEVSQKQKVIVAPGQEGRITFDSLPAAEKLHIHVDLPVFGSGVLTVTENGIRKDTEVLENDTNWDYLLGHSHAS